MGQIKAIITDFDGTLVDTKIANGYAYKESFENFGIPFNVAKYYTLFGYRYDEMCEGFGIEDHFTKIKIHEYKKKCYPKYFKYIVLNRTLLSLLKEFKKRNYKIAIASTANKENLHLILQSFKIEYLFDVILTGEDVKNGKPNPEVYNKCLEKLECESDEVLVFEDSDIGCEAAKNANLNYIKV